MDEISVFRPLFKSLSEDQPTIVIGNPFVVTFELANLSSALLKLRLNVEPDSFVDKSELKWVSVKAKADVTISNWRIEVKKSTTPADLPPYLNINIDFGESQSVYNLPVPIGNQSSLLSF